MRQKRMYQFLRIMKPSAHEVILDVGGYPELWIDCGYEGKIVFLNIENPDTYQFSRPNSDYMQGDGRCLQFPDKSFDIVFSNSVIEHVGGWEDQMAFSAEASRVGKRYWIQTPNKNFPIEPHYNFPFIQFFPEKMREWVACFWPFSFFKRFGKHTAKETKEFIRSIRLLTIEEMKILFPDGQLWKEPFWSFLKSIVAYRCNKLKYEETEPAHRGNIKTKIARKGPQVIF
jgi:SAM-dependent methyltransferase